MLFRSVAFCIFVMIKFINNLRKKAERQKEAEAEPAPAAPEPTKEEQLLAEIRDLLKEQQKK